MVTKHDKEELNNNLMGYFQTIKGMKSLTKDEEKNLVVLAKNGNIQARDKIINSHLKFVVTIAKKYNRCGIPLEDLISEGNMALFKAIQRFDPTRNVRFISCAVWWIRQAIQNRIKEKKLYDIYHVRENLIEDNDELDLDRCNDDEEMKNESFEEILAFDEIDGENTNQICYESIINLINNTLPSREKKILSDYLGVNGKPKTMVEISKEMGLSRERIRQIKEKALKLIRCEALKKEIAYISI